MLHKGGRYLIEPRENDYSLKGTRQFFSKEELNGIAENSPELISPNVVLRPICQDAILPTIAYVGGPSEVAYFAQLKPVYEYFDVRMPVVYPRASVTIMEEKVKNILEKFQVEFTEIWSDIDPLLIRIAEQVSEVKVDALFDQLHRRIHEAVAESRFGIQQIDPTLSGAIDSTLSRIESQLSVLKEKAQSAQQRRQEVTIKQIQKVAANIFPKSNFQEREFNVAYYMNKYRTGFREMAQRRNHYRPVPASAHRTIAALQYLNYFFRLLVEEMSHGHVECEVHFLPRFWFFRCYDA